MAFRDCEGHTLTTMIADVLIQRQRLQTAKPQKEVARLPWAA
jgi:hypothetical protein